MAVKVLIPTPLRPYTEQKAAVEVEGRNVGELLDRLIERYGELRKHLFDEAGQLRSFVNVYVNEEDVRSLSRGDTRVEENDVVSIVPSIAGGSTAAVPHRGEVSFSHEEIQRYSRHLIMPEVGMDGQAKLKQARVLMVGAGGLGAPLGMYLAAAGIGRIGIVDFDRVDLSNLQRQVTYSANDVGRPKLDAAIQRLSGINPHIELVPHEARLSSENALELFGDYDIIVDGTDNFPTRYLVNDACVLLGKPNVYGSIFRFEGQVSVFYAERGPCYRCLYPEPPPPGLVPSCAEGGVLGVLPGIVGSLQALEVIKLALQKGDSMIGRLLVFDALEMRFRELRQRKDPDCPICGTSPTIRELIDYEAFCGIPAQPVEAPEGSVPTVTVEELKRLLDSDSGVFVLDVREPHEWDIVHLEQATLIPLGRLPHEVHRLDSARDIVIHCRSGARSAKATEFLMGAGFTRVRNLEGGILAWADRIDPSLPKY
ncbi:MAG TPA: molybdopterin-synthase adenylyltransferase MoeB [Vicinamibacteria bacterium]|nr:molybdopterin-synthase adenylyltransferase MoeB [Vicinamibacteria bacterium]